MTFYQLPNIIYGLKGKNIKLNFTKEKIDVYINPSLYKYINRSKDKISQEPDNWRFFKNSLQINP